MCIALPDLTRFPRQATTSLAVQKLGSLLARSVAGARLCCRLREVVDCLPLGARLNDFKTYNLPFSVEEKMLELFDRWTIA
jgi:hypothetical protein